MKNEKMKYRIMAVVITLSVLLSYVGVFVSDSYAADTFSRSFTIISTRINWDRTQTIVYNLSGDSSIRYCYYSTYEFTNKQGLGDCYRLYLYSSDKISVNVITDGVDSINNGYRLLSDEVLSLGEALPVYRFPDKATCERYLSGKMTEAELASSALNYDQVVFGSASYDASVPSPDKLYINSLSSSAVNSVWQYTDTTVDLSNVTYKVEVENFYMSSSLFNSIAKGYTGRNGESSWKFNGTIDACNRLKGMTTVETYLSAPTQLLADQVLVSGEVMTDSGVMHTTNTYICKPTDYSGRFASSGNAFFTGASNSHWVEYCGSQITVTPYAEVDGVMKKGSTCVARRFTNDILNGLVGSTYTKIAEDPEGCEYIESTNKQDSSGNEADTIGSLDDSNILQHVKKGFGLAGTNGYVALAKQFFVGVPESIWILIGMALAVSIAVIVFKALRGM